MLRKLIPGPLACTTFHDDGLAGIADVGDER